MDLDQAEVAGLQPQPRRLALVVSNPRLTLRLKMAEARTKMKRTVEIAGKGSVALTAHGEPQAAIADFETFESMRGDELDSLFDEAIRAGRYVALDPGHHRGLRKWRVTA